jgi:hypothetical protein
MASIETDAPAPASALSTGGIAMVAAPAIGLALGAILWWRFGDAVYSQSLLTGLLSCF